jgi:glutamate carboxypeptidase
MVLNKEMLDKVYAYLDDNQENMISVLEQVVSIQSFALEVENVRKVAEKFKSLFEAEGFVCELKEASPNGPSLIGTLGADRKGKPVIFSGHMDTVMKTGAYETPVFKREGNKAYGPGVLDMKGGLVIALFVAKALNAAGYEERPLKIAISGDEEIGHKGSKGAEILMEAAKGGMCAFNMETGLVDNSLGCGRKGRIETFVTVTGVESHAGNDFASGRNAIAEMAHKIIKIQDLTDLEKGTTVTSATIKGGTITNAIPAQCVLGGECRFDTLSEMENFKKKIQAICDETYIEGTSTALEFGASFAPYEFNDQVKEFLKLVKETAQECGLPEVKNKVLGGSSDAAYIQMAGVPVLCSFGIQGQWNHTMREYALLDSMSPRGKLIASVILNIDKLKG